MANKIVSFSVLVGLFLASCNAAKLPQSEAQATSDDSAYQITVPADCNLVIRAAERLQSYIGKTSGQTPKIEQKSIIENKSANTTIIVVGADNSFTNLNDFGLADDLAKISGEGYFLKTVSKDGKDYIFALGKTERGASNAVWHLMRKLNINNGKISIRPLSVVRTPFIKTREAHFLSSWNRVGLSIGGMEKSLIEKYSSPCWSEDRLRRDADMLDSFGYNSIEEEDDTWLLVDHFKKVGSTRKDRSKKITAIADELHKNGQTFSIMVYGSSVKDFKTGKEYSRPGACWNDPCERQVLLTEYNYQANTYGPFTDRIVTHWSDWGGQPDCNKCTIKTALEQHNFIVELFRAKNPNIQSAFSLWNVIPSIWPGYENDDSILDAGILPKDVSLAIPGRLAETRARHIMEKGYHPAVWCWRTLDIEHWHGMHVHTKELEKYFKSIPADIAKELAFHTADDVSQFLILSNLYVAGQLMWDRNQSGSELLREFTRGMFGAENAEKMALIYEAVEKGGCWLCPGGQPALTEATKGAEERLRILQKAKASLSQIKISQDFVPAFPVIIEPSELLEEINAQLGAMITYADFQTEANKLVALAPELMSLGNTETIKKAFEALPKVPAPTEYLWGNPYNRYMIDYDALKKELNIN